MRKVKYVIKTREQVIKQRIIVYTITLAILLLTLILCVKSIKSVQAISSITQEQEAKTEIKQNEKVAMDENKNKIDVQEIIKENTEEVCKKTLSVDEVDLDYTTEYIENADLPSGTLRVTQEGTDGTQKMIIVKEYKGSEYIGEERIPGEVTANSINKVVEIGVGEGVNNYTPKAGDSVWATPEKVKIREAPRKKSSEL